MGPDDLRERYVTEIRNACISPLPAQQCKDILTRLLSEARRDVDVEKVIDDGWKHLFGVVYNCTMPERKLINPETARLDGISRQDFAFAVFTALKAATVDGYPINKDEQQPATVEMYTIYGRSKYQGRGSDGIMRDGWMEMKPIGTVVATHKTHSSFFDWMLLINGVDVFLSEKEYRALVDMMLSSGVWERQV